MLFMGLVSEMCYEDPIFEYDIFLKGILSRIPEIIWDDYLFAGLLSGMHPYDPVFECVILAIGISSKILEIPCEDYIYGKIFPLFPEPSNSFFR